MKKVDIYRTVQTGQNVNIPTEYDNVYLKTIAQTHTSTGTSFEIIDIVPKQDEKNQQEISNQRIRLDMRANAYMIKLNMRWVKEISISTQTGYPQTWVFECWDD